MKNCNICNKSFNAGNLKRHTCLSEEIKEEIIKKYVKENLSIRKICELLNYKYTVIYKCVKPFLKTKKEASIYNTCEYKHNDETKNKISKALKGNRNANHRGDRQSYYNGIRMDSSWEVKTAKYLDDNNYNWKYDSEKYLLSDGRYIHPDFFIYDDNDNLIKIIEVKGYFREANKLKFEMFLTEYSNLKVELWNKNKLKLLQII